MRFKTWPVAALGLIGLLTLTVVAIVASGRRAQEIYTSLDSLNTFHRNLDVLLQRLRLDVNRTEIVARDYLLDLERGSFDYKPDLVIDYRRRLLALHDTNSTTLTELKALARQSDDDSIGRLNTKLADYWETLDPIMTSTPAEIRQGETRFLRRVMVPRRDAILAIAREIQDLNDANLTEQRAAVARREATFRDDSRRLLWQSLSLGIAVVLIAIYRLRALERRSAEQRAASEEAERQMRRLSQELVAAQEEERKHLSRELHDHVGQVLTALRMEISRIERIRMPQDSRIAAAVTECKGLIDNMFRTVRDLTLGLRPAMLDDFGLQPAIEWHVRDFMQRYGIPVDLRIEGDLESLPERHRMCAYRALQEALTNCVRHAQARSIQISVARRGSLLEVSAADDGVGFDATRRRPGLGLRGIDERVKELDGTMTIESDRQAGMRLTIRLPLPDDIGSGLPLARIAG